MINETGFVKIMTFNYRNGGRSDGINAIPNRRPYILEMLNREKPDVIGFQEVNDRERKWLRDMLGTDYVLLGGGRDENYTGEGCPIAFRTDCFDLISFDTFWLSDTPTVMGSCFHGVKQSEYPRLAHALVLKCHKSSELLLVVNTHLDHQSSLARQTELAQIGKYLEEKSQSGLNGVLMGDMNALPTYPEILEFVQNLAENDWKDATDGLEGTYHDFGRKAPAKKIDYIFSTIPFADTYCVKDVTDDGVYCSDHYPVCTLFKLM